MAIIFLDSHLLMLFFNGFYLHLDFLLLTLTERWNCAPTVGTATSRPNNTVCFLASHRTGSDRPACRTGHCTVVAPSETGSLHQWHVDAAEREPCHFVRNRKGSADVPRH